ncbi:MAG: hypothetical protein LBH25_01725 [Fibromonadaceae bacterium]|jgi:hypothetical protein|nr:hypothetical protein [Fibromonadaceae bacterium]
MLFYFNPTLLFFAIPFISCVVHIIFSSDIYLLIEDHVQKNEKDFEKRFNLKYEEFSVRFCILDE